MYPGEVKTCTIENCIVEGFIDLLQTSGNTVGIFLDNLNLYGHIYQFIKEEKEYYKNLSTYFPNGIGSFTADIISDGLE